MPSAVIFPAKVGINPELWTTFIRYVADAPLAVDSIVIGVECPIGILMAAPEEVIGASFTVMTSPTPVGATKTDVSVGAI